MKIKIKKQLLKENRNHPMYGKNMHNIERLDKYLSENGLYNNFFVMAHMTDGTEKSQIKRLWFKKGLAISGGFVSTSIQVNSLPQYVKSTFNENFEGAHLKAQQFCLVLVPKEAIGVRTMTRAADDNWLDLSMESEANNADYAIAPGCMTFAFVDLRKGRAFMNNVCLSWAGQVLSGDDIATYDPWLWNEQNNS